jgi:hypothetical protein
MLSVSSLKVSVIWSVRDSFLRVSGDDVVSAGAAEAFFSLMLFLSGSFRVFFFTVPFYRLVYCVTASTVNLRAGELMWERHLRGGFGQ